MARRIEALLFDLDGTLIDSMPLHHVAWREWHARQGLPFDEEGFFEATAGRTNGEILADLFPGSSPERIEAMAEQKEALYREHARRELQWIAGAPEVLAAAAAQGLKLAICTASPLGNIAVAEERFGLADRVATITSPADGLRGKPHPDIFVEAARRLGVTPEACVVFEDAPLGLEAARRGGMPAVALTTSLPAAAFADHPNLLLTLPDYRTFDLSQLNLPEVPHA